jgi:hypothetical protein
MPEPLITTVADTTAAVWPDDVPITDGGDALIGATWGGGASVVVLPAAMLPEGFFDLRSGVAGSLIQRLVNYRLQVAVVGDIDAHLARSGALRAFVAESNRGRHVWFLPDAAALETRLALT